MSVTKVALGEGFNQIVNPPVLNPSSLILEEYPQEPLWNVVPQTPDLWNEWRGNSKYGLYSVYDFIGTGVNIQRDVLCSQFIGNLPKPILHHDLVAKVRRMLDMGEADADLRASL